MSAATAPVLKPAELQNPLNLPEPQLQAIIQDLGRLEKFEGHLAQRAIRYVVDGKDGEVLLALSGLKEAGESLYLGCVQYSPASGAKFRRNMEEVHRTRFKALSAVGGTPVDVIQRLAETYEAAGRANRKISFPPGVPKWLWILLMEYEGMTHEWPLEQVETVLKEAKVPSLLIDRLLDPEVAQQSMMSPAGFTGFYKKYTGWPAYLERNLGSVRKHLQAKEADHRVFAIGALAEREFDFKLLAEQLVEQATTDVKAVRESLQPVLVKLAVKEGVLVRSLIEARLDIPQADVRHEAVTLYWRVFGEQAAEKLRAHVAQETAPRVNQTIEKLLATCGGTADRSAPLVVPPMQVELGELPLPQAAKDELREGLQQGYERAVEDFARKTEQYNRPDRPSWMDKPTAPKPLDDAELAAVFDFLEGRTKNCRRYHDLNSYALHWDLSKAWSPPEVKLAHVLRLISAFGQLHVHYRDQISLAREEILETYRSRCEEPAFGLRELNAIGETLPNCHPQMFTLAWLRMNNVWRSFCDWEPEAIWPAYAEDLELLRTHLNPAANTWNNYDYTRANKKRNAYRVLAMFPKTPPDFLSLLWDLALGTSKTDRPPAQLALATEPGKTGKILLALQDGRQEVRSGAAEWLGKLGDTAAIEPLKTAFKKEKQEFVKGQIIGALDALDADVNEFLDRETLLKEAKAGLGKKRPKGMEWVPLDMLPEVDWADSGKPVATEILQWWVIQSIQQKSPVCGPLLKRYLQMCRPLETAALAKFILASWISHDTKQPSHDELVEKAQTEANRQWAAYAPQPSFAQHYHNDVNNLTKELLRYFSGEYLGSAIGEKGMLALVSAAGDGDCVKLCEQFIRKHFGQRLAQCKALIDVLAWMQNPKGVQVLLSIANRFRTKSLRKAAEDHVQALADRAGWTLDELADRTIPDGGFARPVDEDGKPVGEIAELVLDYGPRSFKVLLNDELEPVVTREDGKSVKAPPAPAKTDDEELAKAAKKQFSDAKKTVKDVFKRQAERLYEAVCTQRAWKFADWQTYLAQHPIVGRICTRLVWAAFDPQPESGLEPTYRTCFRPLEDGSLTDVADNTVTLPPETLIRVAHQCNVPAAISLAWVQHLVDYDVTPMFQQFGRDTYQLPEGAVKEKEIKDFQGHMLTTFKLRGKGTKLGWIRGDAEDGGCFMVYRKPFPSLELQAILSFTGSMVPESEIPCALDSLYFEPLKRDNEGASSYSNTAMPLGKIPAVLLSEVYNDVKQIAAEGSGYDPEWMKRGIY